MTLPSRADIELPLLLELERAGGRARRNQEFCNSVASHLPQITEDDRRLIRKDGRTNVWQHTVDWARNGLRVKGELDGGQWGTWEITAAGSQRLRRDLGQFGLSLAEAEEFIRSTMTIPQRIGDRWQPRPLTPRPRRPVIAPSAPAPGQALSELVSEGVAEARDALRQRLLALDDTQFEHFCRRLLESLGLSEVRVTGRSHDRGIDGEGTIPFFGLKVAFQAKRYTSGTIGPSYLAEFRGRIQGRYDRGIYITSATFTAGAKEVAEQPGGVEIILVDANRIIDLMIERGLGVQVEPIAIPRVDEDFFAQF